MKEKIKVSVLILFALSGIIGCSAMFHPDYFKLDEDEITPIEVFILSDIHSAEKTYDNEFLLHNGGLVALKKKDETSNSLQFTASLQAGEGLRLMFRTDKRKYRDEPGIVLEWTQNSCIIKENKKLVAKVDSVVLPLNSPVLLTVINEGGLYLITADCDTIINAKTSLPVTEFYLIESMQSELKISGVSFDNLYGFHPEEIISEEGEPLNKTREETIIKR